MDLSESHLRGIQDALLDGLGDDPLLRAMRRHFAAQDARARRRDPMAIIADGRRIMGDLESRRVSRGRWPDGSPVTAAFKRATFAAWEAARDEHRRLSAAPGQSLYASAAPDGPSDFIRAIYGV